uniref:MD2-LarExt-type isoform 1 n=1 Tax=Parasacculina yatsui TaxID=2836420 RepID=A0A8K1RBY7_9CRUS|nr:Sy-MD2-LarExt-type-3 [Parasacculina yatsui]UEK51425.1 Sy-MD2-LarExt-type-1 isoform 1 [Parasacculina yatsui]UEK51426.1 Sy-MD2-LarExt-type-1 isoform 2 [Parasacculina yatsui]UEK51496.1 Sy-MD2-LarExt-type-2 isoform 1 [Parasacculina yatsui]UEK51497.1 Sy-MD2-LarExt-type-2 isoform 2 [Parasacculina yatsui]
MMRVQMLILVVGLFVVHCHATEIYEDCGSSAEITRLEVTGCKRPPCELRRGTNVTLAAQFKPKTSVGKLRGEIGGVIRGIKFPFKKDEEVCRHLVKGQCSSESSEPFLYIAVFGVPAFAPTIRVGAQWTIKNEHGDTVVCVTIPSVIK